MSEPSKRLTHIQIVAIVVAYLPSLLRNDPIPMHRSLMTGRMYYEEVMSCPSENRFIQVTRMDHATFNRLLRMLTTDGQLRSSRNVEAGEKIFMLIAALKGLSVREIGERYQHSNSTVSLVLHDVVKSLIKLRRRLFIKPDLELDPIAIRRHPKYRFFNHCIGAVDGSYIPAVVPTVEQKPFRNRKGVISQNVCAVANLDEKGTIQFAHTGWEGSAHDGRVFNDALKRGLFTLQHKYFLADAGYALTRFTLTPYRGVRYHLKEWRSARRHPENMRELFNLRHAQLRNAIERVFGVTKKRFPILSNMPSYTFSFQCHLVLCCFMLHNFIRLNSTCVDEFDEWNDEEVDENAEGHYVHGEFEYISAAEKRRLNEWRDGIAQNMWDDYLAHGGHEGGYFEV